MGRHKKPTATLAAAGYFRKHPDRLEGRTNEPKPTGKLGPPPEWLSRIEGVDPLFPAEGQIPLAVQCWNELLARIPFSLTSADEHILALTAMLEARVRRGIATAAERNQYHACLREFGMTPASRSNVSVPQDGTGNPFADA